MEKKKNKKKEKHQVKNLVAMPIDVDAELGFIEEWLDKTKHVEDYIEPTKTKEKKKHLDEINFDEEIYKKSKTKEFFINGVETSLKNFKKKWK